MNGDYSVGLTPTPETVYVSGHAPTSTKNRSGYTVGKPLASTQDSIHIRGASQTTENRRVSLERVYLL